MMQPVCKIARLHTSKRYETEVKKAIAHMLCKQQDTKVFFFYM